MLAESTNPPAGAAHIVRLLEVIYTERKRLTLILEYIECDLKTYQDNRAHRAFAARVCRARMESGLELDSSGDEADWPLHDDEPKMRDRALPLDLVAKLMRELVHGTDFLHARRILHRDLKPQNILIDHGDTLKIADFGLARAFGVPLRVYTHEVVTLWYRAPELLLGARHYTTAVDMWSCGTIMAELVDGLPLLSGDSEVGQLFSIFRCLGTPDDSIWPGVTQLACYQAAFPQFKPEKSFTERFPQLPAAGIDLLERMLLYDPTARISARKALAHPFLHTEESPALLFEHSTPTEFRYHSSPLSSPTLPTQATAKAGAALQALMR